MIKTGFITRDNMRLSLAALSAFVDAGGPDLNYPGAMFTLTSKSTGKKAIGYIKAPGTGETYGPELISAISNNWITIGDYDTFISSVLDITSAINSGGNAACKLTYSAPGSILFIFKGNITINSGQAPTMIFSVTDSGKLTQNGVNSYYITNPGWTNVGLKNSLAANWSATGMSLKKVLTPSLTGVTIVSTPGGSNQSLASIEGGFDYNDAAGYTYEIKGNMRELILSALDTRLKTILIANSYNTDLGTAVYHWQTEDIPEDTCPFLVYRDVKDDTQRLAGDEWEHILAMEIDLKYAVDDIADIYDGIEDVMTLLGTIDAVNDLFGQLLQDIIPHGNARNISTQGQQIIVTATINMDFIYGSEKWEI